MGRSLPTLCRTIVLLAGCWGWWTGLGCTDPLPRDPAQKNYHWPQGLEETFVTAPGPDSLRFKQRDLQPLITALPESFTVDTAGRSVEGRPLWRVRWGRGGVNVLLWSQMHGDEATATMALFDIFAWLADDGPAPDRLRRLLADQLTLTFLPMLNPDDAERFQRRNALGIDLNRDALNLTSPEARLLKEERDRLDADWGFNLHDQSTYYAAGFPNGPPCVLSVLAPAYDWEKSENDSRQDAMRLIALMNHHWQREVPGQVGRYNDDFEPRAFGDNLQKWGTRTILIESGGRMDDPEKQTIRRLNVLGILAALRGIATGEFRAFSTEQYWKIPENQYNGIHDLKLVQVDLERPDGTFTLDIGFRRRGGNGAAYVSDMGDLRTFGAYRTIDAPGLRAVADTIFAPGQATDLRLFRGEAPYGQIIDGTFYGTTDGNRSNGPDRDDR